MPRNQDGAITDDYDGKELPEDTPPLHLTIGRNGYVVYLSDENHGKLLAALEPFIKDAEQEIPPPETIGNFK